VVAVASGSPRYRAVRAKPGGLRPKFRAAIEDVVEQRVIRVVDEQMAYYLAGLLNALDRGEPLPPLRAQHHPVRFQLVHDPTGYSADVAVIYLHGSNTRMVASAPSDELAESIRRLLTHVDYPMIDEPSTLVAIARPGRIRTPREPLPEQTVVPQGAGRSKLGPAVYVLVTVLPLALGLGLLAVFAWPFVVAVLLVYLVLGMIVWRRSRR
jgi:hypothetical protein